MKAYSLFGLSTAVIIASCTSGAGPLPYAKGSAGEVLVVMNDNLWKGACGDSIRHYFTEPVMGLPAPEPVFTLTQQNTLSTFMSTFRNIIIINVDAGYEKTQFGYKADMAARNQLIFNLDSPSADSAVSFIFRNRNLITTRFLTKDRDAIIEDYRKNTAKLIVEKLHEKFQVDVVIPNPYKLDVERDNFVWIAREEGERNWGILMWKEPYRRTSQLETDSLIAKMNAMTRKNVPGPVDGSYMAAEPAIPPFVKRFDNDGIYSVRINGLWQVENGGFMGGPYVSHTIVDVKRGQLVTGLGFVFYPNRAKRQMVRQLEAILHTMAPAHDKPALASAE